MDELPVGCKSLKGHTTYCTVIQPLDYIATTKNTRHIRLLPIHSIHYSGYYYI